MVVLRYSVAIVLLFFAAQALARGLFVEVQQVEDESLKNREEQYYWHQFVVTQRRLSGPGSSPPTCRARCDRCFPCRPVHVAIQTGLRTSLEYYPEAWRCKCGNKLFMP